MNVLITGATGLIGRHLVKAFIGEGDEIFILTRNADSARKIFPEVKNFVEWQNPALLKDTDLDVIINLAGMNLDEKRWNNKVKKQIYDSRINSTKKLLALIGTMVHKPEVLINASGVDYYGDTGEKDIFEDSRRADLFISKLVSDWENEALEAEKFGVRVVLMRTGFVIAKESPALKKMVLPFKLFAGGYAGNGKQYLSWIHIDDLVRIYMYVIDNKQFKGAVIASSPYPEKMKDFAKHIGKILHRPWYFPAPRFFMRILFGEAAEVIVAGRRALPKKLINWGFKFNYERAKDAIRDSI